MEDKKTTQQEQPTKEELLFKYRLLLANLKIKHKAGQLIKTDQIRKTKKMIARLLTIHKNVKNN